MAIEHVNILDPDIHEPKGVAAASVNQVYVADGAGSGAWADLEYGTNISTTVGALQVVSGSTVVALSPSTPTKIISDITSGVIVGSGISFNTDVLDISLGGEYNISLCVNFSFTTGTVPSSIKFGVSKDGTSSLLPLKPSSYVSASTFEASVSLNTIQSLLNGDELSVWVEAASSGNLVITSMELNARKVG